MTAYLIVVLTIGAVLARPALGRIQIQPHTAALIGAALMILSGVLPLSGAIEALGFLVRPILTIVSLMAITLVAEHAGLFQLVAWWVARLAKGDGRRLFTYLFVAGTVTGALFTNDAAVLIFTPLVFRLVEDIKEPSWQRVNKVPYYFAVLYIANVVGAFVTSNPINIVVSEWFGIGFMEYARWMALPALTSVVVSYVGLRLFFRRAIPVHFSPVGVKPSVGRPAFLIASGVILLLTLAGFFSEMLTGIPAAYIAAGGALLLFLVNHAAGGRASSVARGIGWDVIAFAIGMFLVAQGLRTAGLTDLVGEVILAALRQSEATATLVTGLTAGFFSAVLNNHPVAATMAMSISDLRLDDLTTRVMALSGLIGGDLGPRMLPIGSLAALMWFRILRAKGVSIPYKQYIMMGVPITLVAIVLSVLVLNLELAAVATR